MGYTRSSDDDWRQHSTKTASKTTAQIFTSTDMPKDLNPHGVKVREARDSAANPNSTPIIVAVDVTGSMGIIAEYLVRTGVGVLFKEILARKPVSDPQLMSMAIGDAHTDKAPLQVSQFEADLKCANWLEKFYLEGNGGGNNSESYHFPLYFAAKHTSTDCFEKRGKKGYLFTIGDEQVPPRLTRDQIFRFIGDDSEAGFTYDELYAMASKQYEVFHIIIAEGNHARYAENAVRTSWKNAIGERAIWLDDYKNLSEVIVSIIQMIEGADYDTVVSSWSGDTSLVVASATKELASGPVNKLAVGASSSKVVML